MFNTEDPEMLNKLFTLAKGLANRRTQSVLDGNALIILEQQIRDAEREIASAKKAVAVAIAHNEGEKRHHKTVEARIADLENRAVVALSRDDLKMATEAAEAIALLEGERSASETAQATFSEEIGRMRLILRQGENKLMELKRGQRIAEAADKAQRLRIVCDTSPNTGLSGLRDAEETLLRLRTRQKHIDDAGTAFENIEAETSPSRLAERMGCPWVRRTRNGLGEPGS
jgi:phage shock protein A